MVADMHAIEAYEDRRWTPRGCEQHNIPQDLVCLGLHERANGVSIDKSTMLNECAWLSRWTRCCIACACHVQVPRLYYDRDRDTATQGPHVPRFPHGLDRDNDVTLR